MYKALQVQRGTALDLEGKGALGVLLDSKSPLFSPALPLMEDCAFLHGYTYGNLRSQD